MPIQLRSGTVNQAPSREFTNVHAVLLAEKLPAYKKKGLLKIRQQMAQAKEDFAALSNNEKKKYEDLLQKHEEEYQAKLVLHYGGSQRDVKQLEQFNLIPDEPKRPLTAFFRYLYEKLPEASGDLTHNEARKQIGEQWLKLQAKDKKKYEDAYEKDYKVYAVEYKHWEEKYGAKAKQMQQFEEEKFQKKSTASDLEYQELGRHRRPREPKPLMSTHESSTSHAVKGKNEDKRGKSIGKK